MCVSSSPCLLCFDLVEFSHGTLVCRRSMWNFGILPTARERERVRASTQASLSCCSVGLVLKAAALCPQQFCHMCCPGRVRPPHGKTDSVSLSVFSNSPGHFCSFSVFCSKCNRTLGAMQNGLNIRDHAFGVKGQFGRLNILL